MKVNFISSVFVIICITILTYQITTCSAQTTAPTLPPKPTEQQQHQTVHSKLHLSGSDSTVTLRQHSSDVIEQGIDCWYSDAVYESSALRIFDLKAEYSINSDFQVETVSYGSYGPVGTNAANGLEVEVRLYSTTDNSNFPNDFTKADKSHYNLLSTTIHHATPSDSFTIVTVPIATPSIVPANRKLIIEVHHDATDHIGFAFASNGGGSESQPSYTFAPEGTCNNPHPNTYAYYGLGQYKIIMIATGKPVHFSELNESCSSHEQCKSGSCADVGKCAIPSHSGSTLKFGPATFNLNANGQKTGQKFKIVMEKQQQEVKEL